MKQERRRFQPSLNPCVWFEIITADSPQRKDEQDDWYLGFAAGRNRCKPLPLAPLTALAHFLFTIGPR
jgi:hypothetical protein